MDVGAALHPGHVLVHLGDDNIGCYLQLHGSDVQNFLRRRLIDLENELLRVAVLGGGEDVDALTDAIDFALRPCRFECFSDGGPVRPSCVSFEDAAISGDNYYFRWVMDVEAPKLNKGQVIRSQGMTHVLFDPDGKVTITARLEGKTAATQLEVTQFADPPPVNFKNEVVPIFTKLGCNGGGCHGKSGGQNNFRLSLLGYEPWNDHDYLVRESRGRRIHPRA